MKNREFLHNSTGFTLIEIMVVICIISILLAIAIPAWVSTRQHAQVRTCMAQLTQIEYAKEVWAMDNHKVAADIAVMDDLYPAYLKSRPACPAGGAYEINELNTTPTCSIGGEHKIR